MEWISVEDRLPEPDSECIVYDGDDVFGDGYYADEFIRLEGFVLYGITHWQPLPPPPA